MTCALMVDVPYFEVFDPEFKYVKEVPSALVRHLPPARLNITRLVFCRNYVPGEHGSCPMGDGCKFVHADVDLKSLESHPIHVKYAWRHEDVCTYARLPAGDTIQVLSMGDRGALEAFPSERVLVTRGSLRYRTKGATLLQCVHYNQHRMCNRGERCNFVHTVFVDPKVKGDFKRAPAHKADALSSHAQAAVLISKTAVSLCSSVRTVPHEVMPGVCSCGGLEASSAAAALQCETMLEAAKWYHHNPYAPLKRYRTLVRSSPSEGPQCLC